MSVFFVELWSGGPPESDDNHTTEVWSASEDEARQLYLDAEQALITRWNPARGDWVRLSSGDLSSSGYVPGETPRTVLAERPLQSDRRRDGDDDDDDWRREMANEAGMGLGIDAFNDMMGSGQ